MIRRPAPYDDYVMGHIRDARNYRVLGDANREMKASNPLCGDELKVQVRVADGRVLDAAFQCECCGISMASASMMTDWVKGRTAGEARRFAQGLVARVAARPDAAPNDAGEMERALLATIREFPSRAGCATLPWTTLLSLLEDEKA